MMVIMALVTTFMTGPALELIIYLKTKSLPDAEEITIIVNTEYYFHLEITRRKSLLRLANSLTKQKSVHNSIVTRASFAER
jgi:hypothetical protein